QIDDETSFTPPAVPACYRMAAVDLTLARQLADRLGGENKAYAYGVLAMGVHAKDPTQARQLLREAFDQLRDLQQLGWAQDRRFAVAFALLGFATTVDPQHSREYFWRTVALCPVTDDRSYDPASHVKFEQERRAKLALLLAIYGEYPDVQRELVEPLFTYWEEVEQPTTATFYRLNAVYLAMGLVDPVRACRWHTEFHPKVARDDRRVIPQPWMTL